MFKDALQKPILEERITILNERISNFQLLIKTLHEKDSIQRESCKAQIDTLLKEKSEYELQIRSYETLTTRLNRQLRFQKTLRNGLFIGVAAAAVKIFLIKK